MALKFVDIESLLKQGTSVELNPENFSFKLVKHLVRLARKHEAKITLRYTDAFMPHEWELLAEDGGSNLSVTGITVN